MRVCLWLITVNWFQILCWILIGVFLTKLDGSLQPQLDGSLQPQPSCSKHTLIQWWHSQNHSPCANSSTMLMLCAALGCRSEIYLCIPPPHQILTDRVCNVVFYQDQYQQSETSSCCCKFSFFGGPEVFGYSP